MAVLISSNPLPNVANLDLIDQVGDDLHALGRSNGNTTIKDVLHEPGEITGLGDTKGNVADAIYDAGGIAKHTQTFLDNTADNVSHAGDQSLQQTANYFVRHFHTFIENVVHITGLNYAAHGVTTLGNTIGFGNLGANNNLLDHTLNLATGRTSPNDSLVAIGKDLSNISNVAPGPITGLVKDMGPESGGYSIGLLGPHGIVGGSGLDLGKLPGLLNTDDGTLAPVSRLVDTVSHATDGVGSASPGTLNLVTDALKLPGEILPDGGPTPSLTDAGHQATTTLVATGDLVQDVLDGDTTSAPADVGHIVSALASFGDTSGPAIGIPETLDSVIHGAGSILSDGHIPGDGAGAVQDLVGSIISDISHDVALANLGSGDGPLGGGLPATGILGPVGDVVAHIASLGGGQPLDVLGGILSADGAAGGGLGSAGAVQGLVGSIVSDISHDVALPGVGLGDGPLGGGLPATGILGPVGDVVANIAALGGGQPLDVLGGILSADGAAGVGLGGADLSHVGAVLNAAPVSDLLTSVADLDHLTSSIDLFGHGAADILHVPDHT